jgi:geranylgeranyl diphosphate synthase type I
VLLARARELADDAERALLDRLVGDPDLDTEGLRRLRELIVGNGALATVEQTIAAAEDEARAALDTLPIADRADADSVRAELIALATAAAQRTR